MNSVASPLRMNMATRPNYQQQARHSGRSHAGASANAPANAPRQPRDDVLARAQAIAKAQAQIQVQVQGYSHHAPPTQRRTTSASASGTAPRRHQQVEQENEQRSRPGQTLHARKQRAMTTASRPDAKAESASRARQQQPRHHGQHADQQRVAAKPLYSHGNCRSSSRSSSRTRNASRSRANTATASRSDVKASNARAEPVATPKAQPRVKQQQEQQQPKEASVVAPVRVPAPAAAPEAAPVAWRVAVDPKSKRPYYYHSVTRETTWKKPAELVAQEKREKQQFFSAMEHNIRSKLRDGSLLRDSSSGDDGQTPRGSSSWSCGAGTGTGAQTDTPPSSRSSASTVSCSSARSGVFKSARSTRSLPATPEGLARPSEQQAEQRQPQQEPESHETDEEGEDGDGDAPHAATKRPMLFRTLSSYETPVMNAARKESGEAATLGVPSPIQERVRLAALAPRASDLEAYARLGAATGGRPSLQAPRAGAVLGGSSSALLDASTTVAPPPASPDRPLALRRRSNSTNSIYLRMGTMNAPDQDATIQCVATVLRAHMMEALEAPLRCDSRFDVFVTARDRQKLAAIVDEVPQTPGEVEDALLAVIPTLGEIGAFLKHVFQRAQMESECIIMSLVYVERLLKATSGSLQLRGENWRRLLFCSMIMASKVWDDLSMCNADFSKIWPELALKEINELELAYLGAVDYNVRVSAVSYAKYYFHLRSMCAGMGMLQAFDESAPLNLDGARKMQVLSEDYQERSKQMPAPRRRSVTITTTSAMESLQAAASATTAGAGAGRADASSSGKHQPKTAKASPAASLEQLVQMQVRVAGGSSLSSSMHRLSSSTVAKN